MQMISSYLKRFGSNDVHSTWVLRGRGRYLDVGVSSGLGYTRNIHTFFATEFEIGRTQQFPVGPLSNIVHYHNQGVIS